MKQPPMTRLPISNKIYHATETKMISREGPSIILNAEKGNWRIAAGVKAAIEIDTGSYELETSTVHIGCPDGMQVQGPLRVTGDLANELGSVVYIKSAGGRGRAAFYASPEHAESSEEIKLSKTASGTIGGLSPTGKGGTGSILLTQGSVFVLECPEWLTAWGDGQLTYYFD